MSRLHLTLVAELGATAAAFAEASELVQLHVRNATRVNLTPEPDLIGHEPTYASLVPHGLLTPAERSFHAPMHGPGYTSMGHFTE